MIMTFFVWRRQIKSEKLERGLDVGVGISALWTIVVLSTILVSNFIGYMEMTPLARGVLRYAPQLYNPFPDVFDDRVCHVDDFGYQHNMPVIYRDGYWECRKMLVNYDDKEYINGLLWGTQDKDNIKSAVPILNADKTFMDTKVVSHVDYLSDRVMSQEIGNAKGDVLALVSNSKDYNVFIRTEFDTLIHNEDANIINSISKKNNIHHHHRNQYNIVQIQYLQEFFQVCSLEKCCMHEKVPVLLEVTANKSRDKFLK